MGSRTVLWALTIVGIAIILQTTLFDQLPVFQVYPDVVLLVVILCARYLDPDPTLLLGFTAGFSLDLLGASPLGLRALVLTLVGYGLMRSREWIDANPVTSILSIFLFSLLGVVLLALIGTLFNQAATAGGAVLRTILLVPVYNTVLGIFLAPLIGRALGSRSRVVV